MNGIWNENFFLTFSANLIPFWLKIMPESGILFFWIFFIFFSEFSSPGRVWTEFVTIFFFCTLFPPISSRFSYKYCRKEVFWFFLFFFYFFRNFLARVEYEQNLGLNFFFLFFVLFHPVLAINNAGKWYFIFLNFFAIFFGIFFPGQSTNGIREKIFFHSFSTYLIPF